jgi:hypothetical protein
MVFGRIFGHKSAILKYLVVITNFPVFSGFGGIKLVEADV